MYVQISTVDDKGQQTQVNKVLGFNHLEFHSLRHFEFRIFDNNFMFLHADEINRALKHHREQ